MGVFDDSVCLVGDFVSFFEEFGNDDRVFSEEDSWESADFVEGFVGVGCARVGAEEGEDAVFFGIFDPSDVAVWGVVVFTVE